MRFHFDSEDLEDSSGPPWPAAPAATMNHEQRVEFLRLVHDGVGRTMACAQLGIETKALKRLLSRNPDFRAAVDHVEQVRADNLYTGLYVAALNGDTGAAKYLLSRADRLREEPGQRPGRLR